MKVVAPRPDRPRPFEPSDAFPGAALHLVDVADGVESPGVIGLELDG